MHQICRHFSGLAVLLTLPFVLTSFADAIQQEEYNCIDQDGRAVDWYIVYQIPRSNQQYAFITSTGGTTFTLGREPMNCPNSMIRKTLNPFIKNDPGKDNFFVYNDAIPKSNPTKETNYAHAKGVVVYGQKKGFWFWHSIPRLIPFPGQPFIFPHNNNGQIAACFSFDSTSGHNNRVSIEIYLAAIGARCKLTATGNGYCKSFNNERSIQMFKFSTIGEMSSEVYYKPKDLSAEIYQEIAARREQNWLVQSWKYEEYSDTPNVQNLQEIQLQYLDEDGRLVTKTWPSKNDHSKFALEKATNVVCIGDLNRAETQHSKGGGLLCLPPGRVPPATFTV